MNKKGNAMIVVMCVLCVFTFISLALLVSAATVVSTANIDATAEQCKISAVSFSKTLKDEISAPYTIFGIENTDFRRWLRAGISDASGRVASGTWPYYEDGVQGHGKSMAFRQFTFDLGESADTVGELSAELFWEYEPSAESVTLHVAVSCLYKGCTHTLTTQYELKQQVREDGDDKYTEWLWKEVWRS